MLLQEFLGLAPAGPDLTVVRERLSVDQRQDLHVVKLWDDFAPAGFGVIVQPTWAAGDAGLGFGFLAVDGPVAGIAA